MRAQGPTCPGVERARRFAMEEEHAFFLCTARVACCDGPLLPVVIALMSFSQRATNGGTTLHAAIMQFTRWHLCRMHVGHLQQPPSLSLACIPSVFETSWHYPGEAKHNRPHCI